MLTNTSQTVYAIARGEDIISDGYTRIEAAEQQLAFTNDTMQSVGLTPDVHIVEVTVKTTLGKTKRYTPPREFETPEPAMETTTTPPGATQTGAPAPTEATETAPDAVPADTATSTPPQAQ